MKDIFDVKLSRRADKDLKKVPLPIAIKLQAWIEDVGHRGLNEVRKISGYHDEPLRGKKRPTLNTSEYLIPFYLCC